MGHPLHPATVHFPITTCFLTAALDGGYFLSTHAPTSTTIPSVLTSLDIALEPAMFPILSYYTNILTLLFSVPAIATGAWELWPILQRDGLSSKKAQVGVLHALINDMAVFGAAYNWWSRRETPQFAPDNTNVLISTVLALPAVFGAAYLGANLVYGQGMGMSFGVRAAKGKKNQ